MTNKPPEWFVNLISSSELNAFIQSELWELVQQTVEENPQVVQIALYMLAGHSTVEFIKFYFSRGSDKPSVNTDTLTAEQLLRLTDLQNAARSIQDEKPQQEQSVEDLAKAIELLSKQLDSLIKEKQQ